MIKMIAGVYGMKVKRADGSEYVKGMGVGSGSFSLAPEKEAELVAKGVAQYVDEVAPIPVADDIPEQPEDSAELPELPDGVTAIPEYSVNDKADTLRKIGEMCGLKFKVGMSKSDMVAALDAHIEANMEDDPDAVVDDVDEVAPTFDASDAVK